MTNSKCFIDLIATRRARELEARTMLDVGCGDGRRALKIAADVPIQDLTLTDACAEMIRLCQSFPKPANTEVSTHVMSAQNLDFEKPFQVMTCFWNVLGHIPGRSQRVSALGKMASLLAENGSLFLDVQNRYNMRAYGMLRVMKNWLQDLFRPNQRNGDVSYTLQINGRVIHGSGHLFNPLEMDSMFAEAGLRRIHRWFVDYQSGDVRRFPFAGQLFYELQRDQD